MKVVLDSPDSPALGLHRLDGIWFGNVGAPGLNGARLGNDDVFKARAGERGLVLFTDARPEKTAGAIFGLVLQNAFGSDTDFYPYGTLLQGQGRLARGFVHVQRELRNQLVDVFDVFEFG